ncbi:hypothetical protein JAAARDRAFT_186654 [Jaapia argillacea MUCL 33604]|uniref:Protein kinase domain-containing protein n=1 Tax=Jaapia argillacea MUCL 33604 TaxID=933084 RepID=A0A067P5F8_9AGAM|nr:hypothetical protein JAAARDRAFT_186654 [Jaapia argillacea MUCL 33604]
MTPISPVSGSLLFSEPSHDRVRETLHVLRLRENEIDAWHDSADLRMVMRSAVSAKSDVEMMKVLQVARDEMPEAIKTLQRALEKEVEKDRESMSEDGLQVQVELEEGAPGEDLSADVEQLPVSERQAMAMSASRASLRSKKSVASFKTRSTGDTLDREFIESGIDALKRMSRGVDVALPNWTITRYEVDREEKIGIGFFSDVYRGTWHSHAVAIKVLAPTTPRQLFVHEIAIWKSLSHPNVVQLLGASSATGDPPWFFVSPYYKNGNLVQYLQNLNDQTWMDDIDVLKSMHEISKGMGYLHEMNVLHGDLKGVNVLVNDDIRCVISDFGQSEMKSEVYRVSGEQPPLGTLGWQAPERLGGITQLTTEMDVYSFAITCHEILSRGKMPWGVLDDDTVRHLVLEKHSRPALHSNRVATKELLNLIRKCWDQNPASRPHFSRVTEEIWEIRVKTGSADPNVPSPPNHTLDVFAEERHKEKTPDMRPTPSLQTIVEDSVRGREPSASPASGDFLTPLESPSATAEKEASIRTAMPPKEIDNNHTYAQPIPTRHNTVTTDGETDSSSATDVVTDIPQVDSPPPVDEVGSETRNERRYRINLQHEFHFSLALPLWTPTRVALGDVGYLSKPSGRFITLFNSFDPVRTSNGIIKNMASLNGYAKDGKVPTGNQRQEKRNVAQRGWDAFQGIVSSRKTVDGSPQPIGRRYTYQLRSGHKTAYLCTETTMYRYMLKLDAPRAWFKANVDVIMNLFSPHHPIQKEDLYLIIGTLDASDYALFVSHHHPDGQFHFNVFASPKPGQHWGRFSMNDPSGAFATSGPSYHTHLPNGEVPDWASKVSTVKSTEWDTVLLARLRFRPDSDDPVIN